MSEDKSSDNKNIRRSKRIAAKDDPKDLMEAMFADLEDGDSQSSASTSKKTSAASALAKKKIYRSTGKSKSESTGTLFDQGLVAVRILGATTIHDDAKGTDDICYLVKYNNGQFELVLNTVAHKCCPMVSGTDSFLHLILNKCLVFLFVDSVAHWLSRVKHCLQREARLWHAFRTHRWQRRSAGCWSAIRHKRFAASSD